MRPTTIDTPDVEMTDASPAGRRTLAELAWQFARFVTTGVLNTAVGLGLIWLCWRVLGLSEITSNFIGYVAGLCVSFIVNRRWTFASDRSMRSTLPRFVAVFAVSYLANLATFALMFRVFHLGMEWSTLIANVPYTLTFFVGSRWFVFPPVAAPADGSPVVERSRR